jgi:hypothetical protein
VRLCDKLQLGVQLLVYRRAGRGGLEDFMETLKTLDSSAFAPVALFHSELLSALENCD